MADGGMSTTEPKVDGEHPAARLDLRDIARSPASRQLMLLVGVALAVAMGVAVVLWSRGPSFGMLYAGLDQKDAAAITQALQASNTPYTLAGDGTTIMAPQGDLAAIRLRLAGQGLPQGSANSTAMPAADSPFGMSDMAERTRYQQMLENDLGSTIGGLQSVKSARVHLALPKPSAFIRDNRQASASVLVSMFPGRQLDASQVAAIVHLVSSSVPELDPGQVSVVDQQGQLLTGDAPDSAAAVGDTRLRLATRIENTYAQRIEELLTPLVGAGKVRAQVYADLDFSQTEKATETYDHDHPALRSEQTASEQRSDGSASGAVPGALSNQPPNTVSQPTAANPQGGPGKAAGATGSNATTAAAVTPTESNSSATRNYELDRTISHVSDPAGRLARLSVAVVVDDKVSGSGKDVKNVPFTAQELEHLTDLAKNAVGFNAARGDTVSVVNQAFHRETASDDALPAMPFWQRPGMLDLIKQGAGILVALLVAFGLLRPLLKGLSRGPARPATAAAAALPSPMPKVSVRVDDIPEDEPARIGQAMAYEQKINMARRLVSENPKQVAQVVRSWVGDNG
ncbi:flagellar basal-body MS-ring/collar protein FliF [Dyella sp.]|jgi:flagellar M-ring protein FliF|uniref:flagellar basal-body MS-ring/collar protein FliF n=1 Tax=Dyella sp. TaxID=1869338 RepID=UPI002D79A7EE|nr:flagellar basal-body MS-ring/collar protein FliF [Dyella sp.]HET6433836.1 flagellar basal-body MS-ring/collar protein FliF [Dyella sp.]